ncbi:MAG: hypothetical protein JWO79_2725 [Actinomycetia bacterium]|nr:hypothetical protein [Actinomycetes bacterium]
MDGAEAKGGLMGRMARPASGGLTKYYWYPGERGDWVQAIAAVGSGLVTGVLVRAVSGSGLWGAVLGATVTAVLAGHTLGKRDAKALRGLTRIGAAEGGRAAWRGFVKGAGPVLAALLVYRSGGHGFVDGWVLPLVPGAAGALTHQAAMFLEQTAPDRIKRVSAPRRAMPVATRRVSTKDTPRPIAAAPPGPLPATTGQ